MTGPKQCTFCGHANHPHPCPRNITTRTGDQPCPCTKGTR